MMENAVILMRNKELPARSPYAPMEQHINGKAKVSLTAAIALFLFVFRGWKRVYFVKNSDLNDTDDEYEYDRRMVTFWNFLERRIREAFTKINKKSRSMLANKKVDGENKRTRIEPEEINRMTTQPSLSFRSVLSALASSMTNSSTTIRGVGNNCSNNDVRQEIRDNRHEIQSVLNYWFGRHQPDVSQKMLWMIASSSTQHRDKVDAEIATKFEYLLQGLSSHNNNNNDPFLKSLRWKQWCLDPDGIYGANGKIAAIIVLDQFSRHILRHYEVMQARNNDDSNTGSKRSDMNNQTILPTKEYLDRLALETAKLLVRDHSNELNCGMIPLPMQIFAFLPYRHADTMESVRYVQQKVEEMANLQEQNEAMIGRFRKATNRRLAILQHEQRRTGTSDRATIKIITTNKKDDDFHTKKNDEPYVTKVDREDQSQTPTVTDTKTATPNFSDDDILEAFPFDANMTAALQHPIHKTMIQFLSEQGIHPTTASSKGKVSKARDGTIETNDKNKDAIILSLSGGVDSMVIACVLAHLKTSCGYEHLTIYAVHIDYANRPESSAEADYVRRYCEKNLGTNTIEFTCRLIGEVTRGITARDDYERIAREIRYDSYRDAIAKAKNDMSICSEEEQRDTIVGVLLGHHRGDLRENVLSNAARGCGPLNLSGMTKVSKNDGITIYRPLLPLEKSFVLDYAHKFGVPYFKDTTPHWSTRGKLRNKLLPLLEDVYGDGSMNNLSNLAIESDECRALLYKSMIGPFLDSIVCKPMGIIIETVKWKDQPFFFWKVVLREALHSVGLGMFSDKSIMAFLQRIKAKKLKAAWLQCRKDYGVYLESDGKVFVFYPSSFPWSKTDAYGLDGQVLEFETVKIVGPWKIRSEIVKGPTYHDSSQLPGIWLVKKAVLSMESFMDGNVEYFIDSPTWFDKYANDFIPRKLIFRQFSKTDRPRAWKNCDLRIQSTLPVLGNDVIASNFIKDSTGTELTHNVDGEMKSNPERLIRISIQLMVHNSDRE